MLKRIEIYVFLNIVREGGGPWMGLIGAQFPPNYLPISNNSILRGERFGLWMCPLGTLRGVS